MFPNTQGRFVHLMPKETLNISEEGNAHDLAGTSAQLHDYDGAIAYLKIAFDRLYEDVIYMQVDERLQPLAEITGYQDIVARLQS